MSNGNIALMTNMAKNGGMPWDCILGAEVAQHYKPRPREHGPDRTPDPTPDPSFNVVADSFVDLAAKLGV